MRPFRQGHAHRRLGLHARRAQAACETTRRSTDAAAERASVRSNARPPGCPKASRGPSTPRQTHPDRARPSTPSNRLNGRAHTGSNRFPPNKFRYFLTLFSKFFASFPHGTCSLSVSRQYLALGEIYLPFRLQSRATRLSGTYKRHDRWPNTGLSPSLAPLSRGLGPRRVYRRYLQTTIRNSVRSSDWQLELFPLHSPLLGESLLLSSPPLIDMLKFSGSPSLS